MTLTRLFVLLGVFALGTPAASFAQATFDPQGKFEAVDPPQPTEVAPGKVEVVDVFWYGCPHCYRFLPAMEAYHASKADYVEIVRMPAIFRDSWAIHARAYYTAKLLKVDDAIHRPIFEAIHDQGNPLDTKQSLRDFFVAQGVDGEAFDKTFESFAVESLLRKSKVMQGRYGVRGTPSVIVNGKFRVSAGKAGGYDEMIDVAEALAADEHTVAKMAAK